MLFLYKIIKDYQKEKIYISVSTSKKKKEAVKKCVRLFMRDTHVCVKLQLSEGKMVSLAGTNPVSVLLPTAC